VWVIDTDVVVAAIRSRKGASAQVIRMALDGRVEIGLSVALALEYEAVVTRKAHLVAGAISKGDAMAIIDTLISVAVPIGSHFRWRPQLRDPNDEMVLEAAVNGGATAIITFNRKDFAPAVSRFGMDLLLPGQALETIR
jgi:putative PIN family toxin of toxin-antitoxin system